VNPITQGAVVNVTANLKQAGIPYVIASGTVVSAQFTSVDGVTVLLGSMPVLETTTGSNWSAGSIVVPLSNAQTAALPIGDILMRVTVGTLTWLIPMEVAVFGDNNSALFPDKAGTILKMRTERLMLAYSSALPSVTLTDDYIWGKLRAAESEIAHTLRVPLAPTVFFPQTPTAGEITALNGQAWAIDPGYEYSAESFGYNDKWGMIKMRNKPLQSVSRVRFAYPGGAGSYYDLPLDWLRMDKKYGTIQFVPSSTAFVAPLNNFVMQAIGGGRSIPLAIQITYVAGLANAASDYPELVDVVMKKASLKIIEDAFLPQSGSISADGLSQSMSVDMDKHHDTIDRILNGGKGSNGGLMSAIHGVRFGVMGA